MKTQHAIKTKKGAASIYVVVFVTLILGIMTVSFVRIMLSEARQTTNYDLSQSAYDSALAGVEDAKVALLKYHECLSSGTTTGNINATPGSCSYIVAAMQQGIANKSCDVVANVLNRKPQSDQEVYIQETTTNNNTVMDQAYTCVTIEEELEDYRAFLNADNRTRIVPVRTAAITDIKGIYFQWYSDNNGSASNFMGGGKLPVNNLASSYSPPLITFELIQTDPTFNLGELSVANGTSGKGTDHAVLALYPVTSGGTNSLTANDVVVAASKNNGSLSYSNGQSSIEPIHINCGTSANTAGFYCGTYIQIPPTYNGNVGSNRNPNTFFLRVTLPYGQPATDFSISLCTTENCSTSVTNGGANDTRSFTAVQARIDSTGRANDLYRRVESRIELVDNGFPYPEFVIETSDDLEKNFWVTANCWAIENGTQQGCNNSGSL